MGWIVEEKNSKKSGDSVPSRYLDSKFKKVTEEIKHCRYLAHTRTCVRICVSTRNCGLSVVDRNVTAFRAFCLWKCWLPWVVSFPAGIPIEWYVHQTPSVFFIYNDTRQQIIKSQVNWLAFFSCCPVPTASSFLITTLSGWGGGDAHRRGGCTGGGGGMHVHPVHPPGYATGYQYISR